MWPAIAKRLFTPRLLDYNSTIYRF